MARRTYSQRMYDKQYTLELRIKDAHSAAMQFQSTFEQYLTAMERIFKSTEYSRLPNWRRAYLRGVYDTLFHQLQNSLVWILTGPDGLRYGPGNDSWLERENEYKQQIKGQHVWPNAWANGEYRPFGTDQVN